MKKKPERTIVEFDPLPSHEIKELVAVLDGHSTRELSLEQTSELLHRVARRVEVLEESYEAVGDKVDYEDLESERDIYANAARIAGNLLDHIDDNDSERGCLGDIEEATRFVKGFDGKLRERIKALRDAAAKVEDQDEDLRQLREQLAAVEKQRDEVEKERAAAQACVTDIRACVQRWVS